MQLSNFCIRRPVFTIVINLLVVLVGVGSGLGLQVRQLPKLVIASVSVTTMLPGATPELVERQITTQLEQAINTVPNINAMTSISRQGASIIEINFDAGIEPDAALSDVQSKVAQIQGKLPRDALAPIVAQAANDEQPVLYLSFADETRDAMEVTEVVRRSIVPLLSTVPGVAQSQVIGERNYAIRIQLDPLRMAALGVTADDVVRALATQNIDLPGGQLAGKDQIMSVVVNTALDRPEEFQQLVLRRGDDGFQIRLGDIGTAVVGPDKSDTAVRYSGQTAIAVGVIAQAGANPLEIGRAVQARLPEIRRAAPPGMQVEVAFDTSVYVQASLNEVFKAVAIAVLLVLFVVGAFLGSIRSSTIVILTIPVSLIGAFAMMNLLNFSINTFTLLAMILAVGLVVDDAIVEVENVQRHVDDGIAPLSASILGSEEVGFAVIATTLTLASVFAPVGFARGVVGQLFREFAFTLSITILISGFVARTLTPMLCGRLLRAKPARGWSRANERGMEIIANLYGTALRALLHARWVVGLLAFAFILAAASVVTKLPGELTPGEDDAYALIKLDAPSTASLNYLTPWVEAAEAAFHAEPEVSDDFALLGSPRPNEALCFVIFRDWSKRARTSSEIVGSIMERLSRLPGVSSTVLSTNPLSGGAPGQAIQLVLKTDAGYEALEQAVEDVRVAAGKEAQSSTNLTSDLTMSTPQIVVGVDRLLAADLGVPVSAVGNTIQALFGGNRVSTFNYHGNIYNVIIELPLNLRGNPGSLDRIYVNGRAKEPIPLGELISQREQTGPALLSHSDGTPSATIGADIRPGMNVGAASAELLRIAEAAVPASVRVEPAGASRAAAAGLKGMDTIFILALIFVYLMLSAQFESFRDPAIVLLSVPLAVCGALIGLLILGGSANLYSAIGTITLVGLIAKHGILITEFANQLRDKGHGLEDALVTAATLRLRPIIMTTVATISGSLPLVLATGAGAASRSQIGIVIVAGMLFGTLVSLFVVPTVYSLLSTRQPSPMSKGTPVGLVK